MSQDNFEITLNGVSLKGYFIRKGHRSEVFEVYSVCTQWVTMFRAGGGYSFNVPTEEFLRDFTPAGERRMRPFYTALEDVPCLFRAYTDGLRWNGWAVPYFELEMVRLIESNPSWLGNITYNAETDEVVVSGIDPDGDIVTCGQEFETPDGWKHLYLIGDGFCWEFCDWDTSAPEDF
jgi:hypothetical protein